MSRVHSAAKKGDDDGGSSAGLSAALRAAKGGDEEAFRVLYRAVQPGLLRYVRVLVGDDAEDVASEAWLQVARDLGSFSGDGDGFRGWVATIARNRALDHLRRGRRRPKATEPVEELVAIAAADDTAQSALDAVGTDRALALIARLPQDQAEAVLLRVVMGLDAKSAAHVLGKRSGAVRTASHRGLRRLAEYLEEYEQSSDASPNQSDSGISEPRAESRSTGVTPERVPTLKEMR